MARIPYYPGQRFGWLYIDQINPSAEKLDLIEDKQYNNLNNFFESNYSNSIVVSSVADIVSSNLTVDYPFTALYFGVDKGIWHEDYKVSVTEWAGDVNDRRYFDGFLNPLTLVNGEQSADIMSLEIRSLLNKILKYKVMSAITNNTLTGDGLMVVDNRPFIGWIEDEYQLGDIPYFLGTRNADSNDTYTAGQINMPAPDGDEAASNLMAIKIKRFGLDKLTVNELSLLRDFYNQKFREGFGASSINDELSEGDELAYVTPTLADLMCTVPIGSVKISALDSNNQEIGWLIYDQRFVSDNVDIEDATPANVYLQCSFTHWMSDPAPFPPVQEIPATEHVILSWAVVGEGQIEA